MPFNSVALEELKEHTESFDLGFIPRKYHIIFLFFLRMNRRIQALHCRGVNLKSDLIKNLLRDFVQLKEFTLAFSRAETKKRDVGPLAVVVLSSWKQL
jgi:hypothetical protein